MTESFRGDEDGYAIAEVTFMGTYTHKGRQYVIIASGLGGGPDRRFAAAKVPTGGAIWTFALMPD